MTTAELLKQLREKNGLTQDAMAEKLFHDAAGDVPARNHVSRRGEVAIRT